MRTIPQAAFLKMLSYTTAAVSTECSEQDFVFDVNFEPAEVDFHTGNPPEDGFVITREIRNDGSENISIMADGHFGSEPCIVEMPSG